MISHRSWLVLAAVMIAAPADARPTASSLSWNRLPGAEACIDAPELARAVEARIGDVLVTPAHADLSIEGRIAPRAGGGWRATLTVSHPGGAILSQRTLETHVSSCRTLDTSLALVISLLVDPTGAPPPPAPTPEVVIREVRIEVPVLVHAPWHVALVGHGDVEAGLLPHVALGATFGVMIAPPGVPRLELAGFFNAAQTVATDLPERTVRIASAGASLAACPALALGPVRGLACAGVRVARIQSTGQGFDQDASAALLVPAAALDGRIELPLGETFGVVAGVGLRVPMRHVRLTYERSVAVGGGEVTIEDAAPVSLWLGVGVVARLW